MILNTFYNILEGWFNFCRYYIWPPYKKRMQKLFQERLEICNKCEYIKKNRTCSICGCFVDAKIMVVYSLDKDGKTINGCPKKFW